MNKSSKKRNNILYIMGIDWQWIHQRPQILAEMLAKDYDVMVLYPRSILKILRARPQEPGLKMSILWTLPYQEKSRMIGWMSRLINYKTLSSLPGYSCLYVGYPLYGRYIPDDYKGKIIYDCMDNHDALYPDLKRVHKVIVQERELANRADLVIASAQALVDKMNTVMECGVCRLVRNGVEIENCYNIKESAIKETYKVGYIGTIAGWFDYELLQESSKYLKKIEYHLIGPGDKSVNSDKIHYEGIVPHDRLYETIREYDCLIMPFQINDIVKSVDPVKLYEYIAFGKCIVSVWYEEIAQFEEFVYFYRNAQEYVNLMKSLEREGFPVKYDKKQQSDFLQKNNWKERYKTLSKWINLMEENEDENESNECIWNKTGGNKDVSADS